MDDDVDWEDIDAFPIAEDEPSSVLDGEADSAWDQAEELPDDSFANAFNDELVNVSASDWDVDADVLWGGDASLDAGIDPGSSAYDFPV